MTRTTGEKEKALQMGRIYVAVRARPLPPEESRSVPWQINANSISLSNQSHKFEFERIFGENCKTKEVYEAQTKDIIASAVSGFNGTVFAYGQTSSGKTHTMKGSDAELGIIPLANQDLFQTIQDTGDREFLLRMSYMEIYNEEINDLLAPEHRNLQIHENIERGIYVAGLKEEIVNCPEQVLNLMKFGESHRHIGETNMNLYSSRSHTIFRMIIESKEKVEDNELNDSCDTVRVSVLNLVDLAGSELGSKTGAEGKRLKEGYYINKSLLTLDSVIHKLSEGAQNQGGHVPYRDSKLTHILQPALGGNANTAIICNITLAHIHADETKSSLQFASKAKMVTNCVRVMEILTDAALLKRQKKEIEELRCKLMEMKELHELEKEQLCTQLVIMQNEIAVLSSSSLMREIESLRKELDRAKTKLKDTEAKLKTSIHEKIKLEGEKAHAGKEIKKLTNQRALLERDIRRHESKLTDHVKNKKAIGAIDRNHIMREYQNLEMCAFEMEGEICSLKVTLINTIAEKEELSKMMSSAESEIESLKDEVANKEQKLKEAESSVRSLESCCESLQKEKEEFEMQVTDALLEAEAQKSMWLRKEKTFIQATEQIKISDEEIQRLSKDLSEAELELEACREEYRLLKKSSDYMISQLKMEKDRLMANITSLEAKIHNDLEHQLFTVTKERDSLMCTNEKLRLKINEAENLRSNSDHMAELELESCREEYKLLKKSSDEMISQLKMEKDELMANITSLEAKIHNISQLKTEKDNFMAKVTALEAKIRDVSGLSKTMAKSGDVRIEANDGAESENDMEISDVDADDSDFVACDDSDDSDFVACDLADTIKKAREGEESCSFSDKADEEKDFGTDSSIPNPVCSCTGLSCMCLIGNKGGWQSSCCTSDLSVYPLPMSTQRPGRIRGRKMSKGVFEKIRQKLAGEGYDFTNAIDLNGLWAKHGSNQHATKK